MMRDERMWRYIEELEGEAAVLRDLANRMVLALEHVIDFPTDWFDRTDRPNIYEAAEEYRKWDQR